jgi:hypothetical protein
MAVHYRQCATSYSSDHPAQPPGAFAIDYRKHMGMLEQGTAPGVYDRYACTADAHLDRPG